MADTVITVPQSVTEDVVAQACAEYCGSVGTEYGSGRKFAATLVAFFRATTVGDEWLTMAHDHKGANGDLMRAKRDMLYSGLKGVGHSNPSVKWKQIKGYAQDFIDAEIRAERIAAGESAEDIDAEASGGANEKRTLQLRLVEDLTSLYKACKREKAATDAQRKAQLHIAAALADLGVDISKL